jgi:hypothetical protein
MVAAEQSEIARKGQKLRTVNWRIPSFALGYVPFVFFLAWFTRFSDDQFLGYEIFVFSTFGLIVLLPLYAIILVWLTLQRIKSGTNTLAVTVFQLVSFIVPLSWLLFALTFNGSPA